MHPTRLVLLAMLVLVAACSGLDPRQLERLHYGMDRREIAALLDSADPAIPVMRFFAADDAGREQEVLIEFYEGDDPHPSYALVSIDGRLAAATIASGQWFVDGQWWRDDEHCTYRETIRCWSPEELRALAREAVDRRMPLEWERLEPIDSLHPQGGRYTAVAMATVLVVPMLLYLPYWLWLETFGDDGFEAAAAARAFLLAAPRTTTPEQVIDVLGTPARDHGNDGGGDGERWLTHELPGGFTITTGFVGGRLLWMDFGSWYDWAQHFMGG